MRASGKVCPRMTIIQNVWDHQFDPGTNIVDVYVRKLREKVEVGVEPQQFSLWKTGLGGAALAEGMGRGLATERRRCHTIVTCTFDPGPASRGA